MKIKIFYKTNKIKYNNYKIKYNYQKNKIKELIYKEVLLKIRTKNY